MPFEPARFNAINDRQYIQPNYFNPETGGIQYNPYAPTPAPVAAVPTNMPMGAPNPGMDFFAQLAGLIGNQQRAPQSSYSGPLSGYADMARQMMDLQKRAAEEQNMMMGIRTPGGVGPFGGVSKDIQNEIFKGRGRAMSGMQYGQPGRASGGRGERPQMEPKGPASAPGLLPGPGASIPGTKDPTRFGTPSQVYGPRDQERFRTRFGGRL